jgi:hypothetical protein
MFRGVSIGIAVVVAALVTGCGSGGSVTYEAHSRGESLALCTACGSSQGNWSGYAMLTARLKADSVVVNVVSRLGLQKFVAFCAPSASGTSDPHVAVAAVFNGSQDVGERLVGNISISFAKSLPQAHDYLCGFRIRRPKGVSSASYARLRAAYARGALLALRLSRR